MAKLTETLDKSVKTIVDKEGKYLTFSLAGEEYGIEIAKIREIIPAAAGITTVPQTPDSIKGVINLRGKVIPVVDLRLRFGMDAVDYTETTCILIVDFTGQAGNILMGVVVDTVSEVLSVKAEDIEDAPTFGTKLDTDYIRGMAKIEAGVKILLDIDKVLNQEELGLTEKGG